jgi:hypothetical protein
VGEVQGPLIPLVKLLKESNGESLLTCVPANRGPQGFDVRDGVLTHSVDVREQDDLELARAFRGE